MKLGAQEAKEWGVVNEVLPKDQLLDRAWELARELVKRPPLTLRYSRQLFTNPLKRAFIDELGHGLARETYAQRAFFPFGGEMAPLDRAWDHEPWRTRAQWRATQRRSPLVTGIQQRLSTGRGKFTTDYPELGTAPGQLRGLDLRGILRRRAQGGLQAKLVVRRADRTAAAQGLVLHPRSARTPRVDRDRPRPRTTPCTPSTTCARTAATRWSGRNTRAEESSGTCRAFSCKYHGWRYGLDGKVNHITNEGEFFDLDKSKLRMPPVHCEVWAGFIFVNLAEDPVPLRSFLGDGLLAIEAYPFEKMTQHYGFSTRINGNWKLAVDSVCEWYHPPYVHGRFIDPDVSKAEKMVPPVDSYHYELFRPHMLTSVPGPPPLPAARAGHRGTGPPGPALGLQAVPRRPFRSRRRAGHRTRQRRSRFPQPRQHRSWGNDQFWLFPNISVQIWARGYYITYTYWPETVDSHIYEIDLYFVPPANAADRLAQELVVDSTIEFAMQDVNTIEATHSALKTRAQNTFHLSDQELLIRQFHTVIRDTVGAYQSGEGSHDGSCPATRHSPTSSRLSPTGRCRPGRNATRRACPKPSTTWSGSTTRWRRGRRRPSPTSMASTSTHLPDDATRLLHLLYSMILVSYAVNVFKQNRIPDSGAAFFEMVAEPAV